ncbi:MAG: hypothetical protein LBB26_00055 [Puniceicoccales bacterium]|jgi:hypothetical protein|nr:hypothetical protein [Puniceicoccales bacterium]
MSAGGRIFYSPSGGLGFRAEENNGVPELFVTQIGYVVVSDVIHLRDAIWETGCDRLVLSRNITLLVLIGLEACVACIEHGGPNVLRRSLWKCGSNVAEIWSLFCFFSWIVRTQPDPNGMIVCDTTWMHEGNPVDPEILPTGTHVDPLVDAQYALLKSVQSSAQTQWGLFTSGRPVLTQVGGFGPDPLGNLVEGLATYPPLVFFLNRQVSAEIMVALLWAGRFMWENAPGDPRTPVVIRLLCMLNFILEKTPTEGPRGYLQYTFQRQLDWPHGGDWGDGPKVLRGAESVLRRLQESLT